MSQIERRLTQIDAKLEHLHTMLHGVVTGVNRVADLVIEGNKAMADKSKELEAAFDELSNVVTTLATDIENQLKVIANPGTPDAALDAAIARAQQLTAALKAKAADLEADDPPPAPPTPPTP